MTGEGFDVRIYCIRSDGTLEPLMGADVGYFHGIVLNVGDTLARWGLDDVYSFYSVQRRYFVNSIENDHGWCVIVRETESAPQMEDVVREWSEETRFWREVSEREKEENNQALAEQLVQLTRKKKSSKLPSKRKTKPDKISEAPTVNGNLEPILRYMAKNPLCSTVDVIPGAGIYRMEQLTELGALVEVERDFSGSRSWQLTDFGRNCVRSERLVRRKPVRRSKKKRKANV